MQNILTIRFFSYLFFLMPLQAQANSENESSTSTIYLILILVIAGFAFFLFKKQQFSKNHPNQGSHHSQSTSKSDDHLQQAYLDCFENYKNKMLPIATAYYLNIKAKELDLSFEDIDILYEQYGRCQIFPNIQTDDILKEVPTHQSISQAGQAAKIWGQKYQIESNSSSVVFYIKEVLVKLSKEKSQVILDDFIKQKGKQ